MHYMRNNRIANLCPPSSLCVHLPGQAIPTILNASNVIACRPSHPDPNNNSDANNGGGSSSSSCSSDQMDFLVAWNGKIVVTEESSNKAIGRRISFPIWLSEQECDFICPQLPRNAFLGPTMWSQNEAEFLNKDEDNSVEDKVQQELPNVLHDITIQNIRELYQCLSTTGNSHVIPTVLNILHGYASMNWIAPMLRDLPALLSNITCWDNPQVKLLGMKILITLSKNEITRAPALIAAVSTNNVFQKSDVLCLLSDAISSALYATTTNFTHIPAISIDALYPLVVDYVHLIHQDSNQSSASLSSSSAAAAATVALLARLCRAMESTTSAHSDQKKGKISCSIFASVFNEDNEIPIPSKFKTAADFSSRDAYAQYLDDTLQEGWKCQLISDIPVAIAPTSSAANNNNMTNNNNNNATNNNNNNNSPDFMLRRVQLFPEVDTYTAPMVPTINPALEDEPALIISNNNNNNNNNNSTNNEADERSNEANGNAAASAVITGTVVMLDKGAACVLWKGSLKPSWVDVTSLKILGPEPPAHHKKSKTKEKKPILARRLYMHPNVGGGGNSHNSINSGSKAVLLGHKPGLECFHCGQPLVDADGNAMIMGLDMDELHCGKCGEPKVVANDDIEAEIITRARKISGNNNGTSPSPPSSGSVSSSTSNDEGGIVVSFSTTATNNNGSTNHQHQANMNNMNNGGMNGHNNNNNNSNNNNNGSNNSNNNNNNNSNNNDKNTVDNNHSSHNRNIEQESWSALMTLLMDRFMCIIDQSRRQQSSLDLPQLPFVFRMLTQPGTEPISGTALEKYFEKLSLSSGRNKATCEEGWLKGSRINWESNGAIGTHWIQLYVKKGVEVRRLGLIVAREDGSYIPNHIQVSAGKNEDNLTVVHDYYSHDKLKQGVFELEVLTKPLMDSPRVIRLSILSCIDTGHNTRMRGFVADARHVGSSGLWGAFEQMFSARTQILYSTLARKWFSRCHRDINQILEGFVHVERAVRNEQALADSYFRSHISRHSLGLSIYHSVITPLLQVLMDDDAKVLRELIGSYLMAEEGNDVNNDTLHGRYSTTRRLCHLLTEADIDGETSKILYKLTYTLTADMFRGFVRKHRWTQDTNAALNGFIMLYQRISLTLLELFGCQLRLTKVLLHRASQFAFLSLNDDDCAAVANCLVDRISFYLDIVTAPQFQPGETPSTSIPSASSSSSSYTCIDLESLLDIASVFARGNDIEQLFGTLYSQRMSHRLLRGRTTSLSEEERVAKKLQISVESSLLQMLDDMQQSQELNAMFARSQHQRLDSCFLSASENIGDIQQRCALNSSGKFKVFVLNPAHWPRIVAANPKGIPKAMSSFCSDYSEWFSTHSAATSLSHERTKTIIWCLNDGWGTVEYLRNSDNMEIIASTPQISVLYQYNHRDQYTYAELLGAAGLDSCILRDALLSLCSDKHPVLCSTSHHSNGFIQESDVFTLNTHFAPAEKVVRLRSVHVVDASGLTAGSVLERQRTCIDAAIVRIAKREKTIGVESLIGMVMEALKSTGLVRHSVLVGRINHLIKLEYLQRDAANANLLHYQHEPTANTKASPKTPEQQQQHQQKPSLISVQPIRPTASMGVETITSPTSSSLPSSSPISRSFIPLEEEEASVDAMGEAVQRLKSWMHDGGASSILLKLKHLPSKQSVIPTQLTRVPSDQRFVLDEIPTVSQSIRTVTANELKIELECVCTRVSEILHISTDKAEILLAHALWDEEATISRYTTEREAFCYEAGLLSELACDPPTDTFLCPICDSSTEPNNGYWLHCGHALCIECWNNHITAKVSSGLLSQLKCPIFMLDGKQCPCRPTRSSFMQLTSPEIVETFNMTMLRSFVDDSGNMAWCRNPSSCDGVVINIGGKTDGTCGVCGWNQCLGCSLSFSHQPATCLQMQTWMEAGGFYEGQTDEEQARQLIKVISKPCPQCKVNIQKNEGCDHMTCKKCLFEFCWLCLNPWSQPNHCTVPSKAVSSLQHFAFYNEKIVNHYQSGQLAAAQANRILSCPDAPPEAAMFLLVSCQVLIRCRQVLMFANVRSFCVGDSAGQKMLQSWLSDVEIQMNALQKLVDAAASEEVSHLRDRLQSIRPQTIAHGQALCRALSTTLEKTIQGFEPIHGFLASLESEK